MEPGIEIVIEKKKLKKGRPRKVITEPLDVVIPREPLKRGRKKKEKLEETEPKKKLKRGRKAVVKYFSSSIRKKMPLTTSLHDTDKCILHLDVPDTTNETQKDITFGTSLNEYQTVDHQNNSLPVQLGKYFENEIKMDSSEIENIIDELSNKDTDNFEADLTELYEKRIESRIDQDALLIEKLEKLNTDDKFFNKIINNTESFEIPVKKINKNTELKKRGFFQLYNEFIDNDNWLHSTNINCWWCCHKFDTVPIGIPVKYNMKISKFLVKGIFCTFGCMTAYNKIYNIGKKSLIKFMYSKLTGTLNVTNKDQYQDYLNKTLDLTLFDNDQSLKDDYITGLVQLCSDKIQEAPPKCSLQMFGGELTIDEFRNSFKENRIYKMLNYPLSVSRDYIEEVDIQNVKNININVFNKINSMKTSTNILDNKKIEETQSRVKNTKTNVITNNSIDRFLSFT